MAKKYGVKKYLKSGGKFNRYLLQVGSLELYFKTIKEAEEYYQKYLK